MRTASRALFCSTTTTLRSAASSPHSRSEMPSPARESRRRRLREHAGAGSYCDGFSGARRSIDPGASLFLLLSKHQAAHHRIRAEACAQAVDGALGVGGAPVDEVEEIAALCRNQRGDADTDQAVACAVGLVR